MSKPGRYRRKPSGEMSFFTDRRDQQDIFRKHLASPGESPVLVFFGVGGAGKTWLLQKLRDSLDTLGLPSAYLDLEPRAGGQRFLADPAFGLHEIRQQFGAAAPRFDLAYSMMRFKEGAAEEPGFRGDGTLGLTLEIAAEVVQKAADTIPGVNVVLNRISRHLRDRLRDTPLERFLAGAVGSEFVLALRKYSGQEIGDSLLNWLAEDLRESLTIHLDRGIRAVLFVDTFEAINHGLQNDEHQRFREQWIRELASNFEFALIVIAGQNRVTWADAEPEWYEHLDQHLVGGLSETDARCFLGKCGIVQVGLQNAILHTSRESDASFHCFSLGLCADIVDIQRENGQDPHPNALRFRPGDWEALARRFLKSLKSDAERRWIERLSRTPRFDESAARSAFSNNQSAAQDEEWETLHRFSFVDSLKSGWFAIRNQMRRALENQPITRERGATDALWWQQYWTSRSTSPVDDAASLAWYHRYAREPTAALEAWNILVEAARDATPPRKQEHLFLLQWWEPIELLSNSSQSQAFARSCLDVASEYVQCSVGNWAAYNRLAINYCAAAQIVFSEVSHPSEWAEAEFFSALAWLKMPHGNPGNNVQQAIACLERALRVHNKEDFADNWAIDQIFLAGAWCKVTSGNRTENLQKAMDLLQTCEGVVSESSKPLQWGIAQTVLAGMWYSLQSGNRKENLTRAYECLIRALRVLNEQDTPIPWAAAQSSLSTVLRNRDLLANNIPENPRRAVECAEAALGYFTAENFPQQWAENQNNLGAALAYLNDGNREQNLRRALDCYNLALNVISEQNAPHIWAITQNNIGYAYAHLPGNDPANLKLAIEFYEAAARIDTERDFPIDWARLQENLSAAWARLPGGNPGEHISRAINSNEACLRVYNEHNFPESWAQVQFELGNLWLRLPTGELAENLDHAIEHLQASLRVYTEARFPLDWAWSQQKLGRAWSAYPITGDHNSLTAASKCFRLALRVFTETSAPATWAEVQNLLGVIFWRMAPGDEDEMLPSAINCFEAALRLYTFDTHPEEWARNHFNLGVCFRHLKISDRAANLRTAILHFEEYMRVYTEQNDPQNFAAAQNELARCWDALPEGFRDKTLTM